MTRTTHILLALLLALGYLRGEPFAQANERDLWARLAQGGVAVLMRHALAPGFSDPPTFPLLKPEAVGGVMFVPDSGNLAAHELLSGYLKHARAAGARVRTGVTVTGIAHTEARISGVQHDPRDDPHALCGECGGRVGG